MLSSRSLASFTAAIPNPTIGRVKLLVIVEPNLVSVFPAFFHLSSTFLAASSPFFPASCILLFNESICLPASVTSNATLPLIVNWSVIYLPPLFICSFTLLLSGSVVLSLSHFSKYSRPSSVPFSSSK